MGREVRGREGALPPKLAVPPNWGCIEYTLTDMVSAVDALMIR